MRPKNNKIVGNPSIFPEDIPPAPLVLLGEPVVPEPSDQTKEQVLRAQVSRKQSQAFEKAYKAKKREQLLSVVGHWKLAEVEDDKP